MAYRAKRTIKGRTYEWLQESYREDGKVKTRYLEYLGPADGGIRKKRRGVFGMLLDEAAEAVRLKRPWDDTQEMMLDRVAKQAAEYKLRQWVNVTLANPITLADMDVIARVQNGELVLKETSHRVWELGTPDPTQEPTSHAPRTIDRGDGPADAIVRETEQGLTDAIGRDPMADATEIVHSILSDIASVSDVAETAQSGAAPAPQEPSAHDTPSSEPGPPAEQSPADGQA